MHNVTQLPLPLPPDQTAQLRSTNEKIRRMLLEVCEAKGLERMHPYELRHACATHMLDNGASLVVIQQLLGPAKLSTTAQYAFVSTGLIQKTYSAAHPSCQSEAA